MKQFNTALSTLRIFNTLKDSLNLSFLIIQIISWQTVS